MARIQGVNHQTVATHTAFIKQGAEPSSSGSGVSFPSGIHSSKASAYTSFWSCVALPFKKIGEAFMAAVRFLLCIKTVSVEDKLRFVLRQLTLADSPLYLDKQLEEANNAPAIIRKELAARALNVAAEVVAADTEEEVKHKLNEFVKNPGYETMVQTIDRIVDGTMTAGDLQEEYDAALMAYQNELMLTVGSARYVALKSEVEKEFASEID